jgi:VanZ family protein
MKQKATKKKKSELFTILIKAVFYLYLLVLLIIAWTPGSALPSDLSVDSTLIFHYLEFFILAILAIPFVLVTFKSKVLLKYYGIGIGVAAITELVQNFIPGRGCGLDDFLTNIAGYFSITIILLILIELLFETLFVSPEEEMQNAYN